MQLTTERLILRDFTADDWQDVLAYQQDPRYLQYYDWETRTPEAVQSFIQIFLQHQERAPRHKFQLAITIKGQPQVVGSAGIRLVKPNAHEAEIGYELAPNLWGNGYATEAMQAMLRFGIEHLKPHRISAWCIADNAASARVLEKIGLQQEGRLRHKEYFKQRWWDVLVYAVLAEEWRG